MHTNSGNISLEINTEKPDDYEKLFNEELAEGDTRVYFSTSDAGSSFEDDNKSNKFQDIN